MRLILCEDLAAVRTDLGTTPEPPVLVCNGSRPEPERLEEYSRGYRDCIARLSAANAGPLWWANPVSEKNEHDGDCYRHLVWYAEALRWLKRQDAERGVVVAPAPVLLQLSKHCAGRGIACEARFQARSSAIVSALRRLKWIAVFAARILLARCLAPRLARRLPRARVYVLRTWLGRAAAQTAGEYRDAFFGNLHLEAARRGYSPVFVAGILGDYARTAAAALRRRDVLIVPEERFLRLGDVLECAFAPALGLRHGSQAVFMGEDVGEILSWHIRLGYATCAVFFNLLRRAVSRRLNAELKPEVYVQTFENYAWEKLAVAGLREAVPHPFILGFQHAFLCQDSFKYFPGPGEAALMPMPDRIVTLGETTAGLLRERGEYSGVDIRVGCALRQSLPAQGTLDDPLPKRALIPLSLSRSEISRILRFLSEANGDFAGWEMALRFHPHLSWEAFSRGSGAVLPEGVTVSRQPALDADLKASGALAYTWSTVALEAYARGIPVIHLDILSPLRVDPLFGAGPLKRTAAQARELRDVLAGLPDSAPAERRAGAAAIGLFTGRYFHPERPESLESFFPDRRP